VLPLGAVDSARVVEMRAALRRGVFRGGILGQRVSACPDHPDLLNVVLRRLLTVTARGGQHGGATVHPAPRPCRSS